MTASLITNPIVPPGMVWLASYPKSGNTWLRILLANLLDGDAGPQDINNLTLPFSISCSRGVFDDLSLLDSRLLREEEIERLRPAIHDAFADDQRTGGFAKTHDAYTRLEDGTPLLGRRARAVVYMVRDPRDVAISFAFHSDCPVAESIKSLNDPSHAIQGFRHLRLRQRLLDWSSHVTGWLDQADIPLHLIRYEDMQADTVGVFTGALAFLGAQVSADRVARAVRHADFAELQRQEQRNDFIERAGAAPFFREGKVGGWRESLTADQVRAIENTHGAVMDRLGYQRECTIR